MKIFLLCTLLVALTTRAIEKPSLAPGRWSRTNNLPPRVDQFVRRKHPEVATARVGEVMSQVAAGTNYRIVYKTSTCNFKAEVFHRPWTNTIIEKSFSRA